MEKELYKALATILVEDRTDQYGNRQTNPLMYALDNWAVQNKVEIAELIVKKIGKEELSEKIAKKVVEQLTATGWNKSPEAETLRKEVNKILAEKLAVIELEKLTKNNDEKI